MRILHIEDDAITAASVALMLRADGFDVETAEFGEDGLNLATLYSFDLILLDMNLPDISGLEVLRRARLAKVRTPVMVVTGSQDHDTKMKSYRAGCDDYMLKPFHRDELTARIRAVVRRSQGHHTAVISCGDISLDLDQRRVTVSDKPVHLTVHEYKILECLLLRRGRTASKTDLLDYLYAGRDEPELKIIDVFVCKVRRKLYLAACTQPISTVWGVGYAIREQVIEAAQ